ncbi:MAG: hypothetical protein SFX73_13695 [Kofleriaceae bacterium]|nr:hypothetical protein [Kofleriaceae bacterium]
MLGLAVGANARGRRAAACTRIAHRLRTDGLRVVGFVPADPRVSVAPLLVEIGLALCELAGTTVAVVDANARYPSLPNLAKIAQGSAAYSARWLRGALALISPSRADRSGEVVPRLARVLLETNDLFGHLLVDLSGFERLGEHATAAACMDAVGIVGRAHQTHERTLNKLAAAMPQDRFLGVVLVG